MFNCHKLFINNRIFAVFHTRGQAEFILRLLEEGGSVYESEIRPSFIENIGF